MPRNLARAAFVVTAIAMALPSQSFERPKPAVGAAGQTDPRIQQATRPKM
jgi:hypothetical protein